LRLCVKFFTRNSLGRKEPVMNMGKNLNHLWGTLVIEELIRQGVNTFSLSPGSRCTPLSTAVALHDEAEAQMHFDERGAAFFALGYARATGKPAAVICTSGTAVANFFPAVVEASLDGVPLIVLTADRPPELLHAGANQAIDQKKIFGGYVREFFELPCPDTAIAPEVVLTTVDQVVYRACRSPKGPVHLNCQYREPLDPGSDVRDYSEYMESVRVWEKAERPYTHYIAPQAQCPQIEDVGRMLSGVWKGLIVVGQLDSEEEENAVVALAEKLQWPLFPDIASGLRLGVKSECVVPFYDKLLEICDLPVPDMVLQIGGQITSKRLLQYLKRVHPRHYLVVKNHPLRHDPEHLVIERIEAEIAPFCWRLTACVDPSPSDLLKESLSISQEIEAVVTHFSQEKNLSEIAVAHQLGKEIPNGHGLFLASSLAIRQMDMFASIKGSTRNPVAANRGASGIDGTIASASGYAQGLDKPVTLLIGDLAFLHDLNSLSYLHTLPAPVFIIVVNNRGGGLFSFLPISQEKRIFTEYFETPHNFTFSSAAQLFQIPYKKAENFVEDYRHIVKRDEPAILEVVSNCADNIQDHKTLLKQLNTRRDQCLTTPIRT